MALTGVTQQQVGSQYSAALGFRDPSSTNTNMVGYVLKQGTMLEEDTDIQGNDRLVQISSPSSTDRFTYYPKVSQGDWSGGERQYYFVDPARYFSTDGNVENSAPGQLYALAAAVNNSGAITGNFRASGVGLPSYSDSNLTWVGGVSTLVGNPNLIETNGGGVSSQGVVGTNGTTRVHDIIADPNVRRGVFVRVSPGIWRWNGGGSGGQVTNTVFNDPSGTAVYTMAVFNGVLYYTDNTSNLGGTQIRQNILATNVDTVAYSSPALGENCISLLRSGSDGLIFIETQDVNAGSGSNTQLSWLYTWDGASAPVRRAQLLGEVLDMIDALGTTYIMVKNQRNQGMNYGAANSFPYTLYSFSGSSLQVFDDLRFALADFRPQGTQGLGAASGIARGQGTLHFDGRFLYAAAGGTQYSRYDLLQTQVSVCNFGTQAASASAGFSFIGSSTNGIVQGYGVGTGANVVLLGRLNDTPASNPTLTTSYFDFSTPTTVKAFLSVEVEPNPISTFQAPTVSYRLDNATAYTNLTASAALANGIIPYYFPAGTKGTRIQLRIQGGLFSSASIRSYSLNARLGRVWKATFEVFRNQRLLNGGDDQQGTPNAVNGVNWTDGPGQYRLANVENCYKLTAGRCTLFVPSPTVPGGTEQVNAVIQSYNKKTMQPGPSSSADGAMDMEGEVDLVLVEDL